ncbi:hypothetical protein [Thermincola ferriacetica]
MFFGIPVSADFVGNNPVITETEAIGFDYIQVWITLFIKYILIEVNS